MSQQKNIVTGLTKSNVEVVKPPRVQEKVLPASGGDTQMVKTLRSLIVPDASRVLVPRGTVLTLSKEAVEHLKASGLVEDYTPPAPPPVYSPEELAAAAKADEMARKTQVTPGKKPK